MSLMSSAALARVQATATASLPESGQVERLTRTENASGGFRDTWALAGPVFPCQLTPWAGRSLSSAETVVNGQFEQNLSWKIAVPVGTDVTAKDRVITSGRTFEVSSVLGPAGLLGLMECYCVERLAA